MKSLSTNSPKPLIVTPVTVVTVVVVGAFLSACRSTPSGIVVGGEYLSGQNYSYAVYDASNRLIHSPIENLRRELERRDRPDDAGPSRGLPVSDVYVVCHGWNFTIEESAELFENYRISLEPWIDRIKQGDPSFEPYFIFVTWGSVSRPISDALSSVSPFDLPVSLGSSAKVADAVTFHLPSNWGETTDAFRLALGDRDRWTYDPRTYDLAPGSSEYRRLRDEARAGTAEREFDGYDIPVSTLLDELIRIKCGGSSSRDRFRLHAIGHSFGGKLVALAVFDAIARIVLAHDARSNDGEPVGFLGREHHVDSLLLIDPAMKVAEMYFPPDVPADRGLLGTLIGTADASAGFRRVAEHVRKKALVFSHHDSANGWLFGVSQLLLRYETLSEHSYFVPESRAFGISWLSFSYKLVSSLVLTAVANAAAVVVEPIDAIVATAESDGWMEGLRNFASIPFSPIGAQRSMGNCGFRRIRFFSGALNLRNPWITKETRDYLNSPTAATADEFKKLTEFGSAPVREAGPFYAYDASAVYNGYVAATGTLVGSVLNQVLPHKAHGDVRSYDEVDGISKRVRTFNFLYNFTRAAPSSPATGETGDTP
ncbi:MAG: hypothetical protein O7J95_10795 [Planctomycetota bacterium]|nr:hypothetical protein [Planctomycetota bacterium]